MSLSAEFLDAAKFLLGNGGYTQDADALQAASTPWRGNYSGETPFLALPNSTQQVADLLKLCHAHKVCVTPQGGNTGLVDAGTPHGEITLSLRRMQSVRDIDPFNNSLTIEAGAPLVSAQKAAEDANRLFPLSLGSEGTATIGGLISTNAGGVAVLRYGMMRDLLLGLEVVLANGEIWSGLSGLRKNNTGYDLKHIFAGAEGTLGIITAATLKLYPKTGKATAWITCPSARSVVELLALVRDFAGDTVTSFEIIPSEAIDLVIQGEASLRDPNPSNQPWRVLCEVSMPKEDMARTLLEDALAAAFEAELASDALIAENLRQAREFWTIRETIPLSKRAYGTAINHDISVPISKIPDFLIAAEKILKTEYPGATLIAFGHVGDGNLHYSVCESPDLSGDALHRASGHITDTVHALTRRFGGSISAEHGVGRLKRDELAATRPAAATEAMIAIKRALDPEGLLNPGRVVKA